MLQPDDGDEIVVLLKTISSQLHGFTISPPFVNSTFVASPVASQPFQPPSYAVWLNTLWFTALICSLSATSIAITVRQWLQQYATNIAGDTPEAARLRQYRYESLLKWRVGDIITVLPLLLQLALAFFLAGLLGLLYTLHPLVFWVCSVLVAVLCFFMVLTTILPTLYEDCSYQSPQSLYTFQLWQFAVRTFRHGVQLILTLIRNSSCHARHFTALHNLHWQKHGLFPSWEAREQYYANNRRHHLDWRLLQRAYQITGDESLLTLWHESESFDVIQTYDVRSIIYAIRRVYQDSTGLQESVLWLPVLPYNASGKGGTRTWILACLRLQYFHAHMFAYALSSLPQLFEVACGDNGWRLECANEVLLDLLDLLPGASAAFCSPADGFETVVAGSLIVKSLARLYLRNISPVKAFCKLVNCLHALDSWRGDIRLNKLAVDEIREGEVLYVGMSFLDHWLTLPQCYPHSLCQKSTGTESWILAPCSSSYIPSRGQRTRLFIYCSIGATPALFFTTSSPECSCPFRLSSLIQHGRLTPSSRR